MKKIRTIIAHALTKKKIFSICVSQDNYIYLKSRHAKGEVSKFVDGLITEHRQKEMKQEAELNKWREIIYK